MIMSARTLIVPILAVAVAGLAFGNYQLSNYAVDTTPLPASGAATVNATGAKDGASTLALPQRGVGEFPETTTRPIFFSGRRVPEKPKPKPVVTEARLAAPVVAAPPPEPLQLVGIMGAGSGRRALLRTTVDPQGIWLSIGDEYRGWKLREISADNAVVEAQGLRSDLRLYAANSGKTVKR